MSGDTSVLLVTRLSDLWDPFVALDLDTEDVVELVNVTPREYWNGDRDTEYHLGRIRYFLDHLTTGADLDPIEVDNQCDNGHIYPIPILDDGNHRFAAYIIAGRATIPANYGGRVDLLEYLEGTGELPGY